MLRKIPLQQFFDSKRIADAIENIKKNAAKEIPGRRDRLFQEDLIVVAVRDQLSARLIESPNRGTVAGWIPVLLR